jgi:very-short-patch-repair endonuclease
MFPQQIDPIIKTFAFTFLKFGIPALLLCAVLSVISARLKRRKKQTQRRYEPKPLPTLMPLSELPLRSRRPLTPREEQMFFAITAALPECTILAQVSFQALLDTPSFEDRNRFNRKYADFLICSKRLTPVAIVELDDSSHNSKKADDEDRDAMLQRAGYQTIRYRDIPSTPQIRGDLQIALTKLKAVS